MFENVFAHDHDKAHDHKKTKIDHKMLKEENGLLKKEIEAYKERVWDFNEKQYIETLEQEREELQDQVLKIKNATKAFKQDEDKYVNNIIQLEAKNKDLENIVCKMGKSSQTLPIACHPKLYDAEVLGLHYVKSDVHDTEEILNDAERSYVEIKNKEEIKRFSKESKDSEKFCNDVAEVKKSFQSSRVETIQCDEVKIKFEFDKIENQNIELEHQLRVQTKTSNGTQNKADNLKSQLFEFAETKFNNILGKIESLKKNQFDSFSSLNVVCNSSELETESGEKKNLFESETCVFQIKIVELEKTLAKETKENSDLLIKVDNLENAFADEVKRTTMGKLTAFDKDKCDFGSKVTHLEKIIAQKTKDFDDVKLELSNRTTKFEAYFEKLENTKVILERQLAHKVDDSKAEKDQFLKEIIHLRT
ncbi:hypothetical protein Tco_0162742 [Tanacetum coccineum]